MPTPPGCLPIADELEALKVELDELKTEVRHAPPRERPAILTRIRVTENAITRKQDQLGACIANPPIVTTPTPTPPASTTIRILTFNVYGGRNETGEKRLPAQAQFIKDLDVDVAMLQEVSRFTTLDPGVDQAEQLASQAGFPYFAFYGLPERGGGWGGSAILSKFPLEDVKQVVVPRPWWIMFTRDSEYLMATVHMNGRAYRVIGTHLFSRADGGPYRKLIMEWIAGELKSLPAPVTPILAGDFNMGSEDPEMQVIRPWVNEVFLMLNPNENAPEIDQVWVGNRAGFQADSYDKIPALEVSDHSFAIRATVRRP